MIKTLVLLVSAIPATLMANSIEFTGDITDSGLEVSVTNDEGESLGYANVSPESWDGEVITQYVARFSNGQFATGYRGKIEWFDVGEKREERRIVFRDSEGQFMTWISIEDMVSERWNHYEGRGWAYEVRYKSNLGEMSGQLVNLEFLNSQIDDAFISYGGLCPRLVLRDTNDGKHNGKIVTSLNGRLSFSNGFKCVYKDQSNVIAVRPFSL